MRNGNNFSGYNRVNGGGIGALRRQFGVGNRNNAPYSGPQQGTSRYGNLANQLNQSREAATAAYNRGDTTPRQWHGNGRDQIREYLANLGQRIGNMWQPEHRPSRPPSRGPLPPAPGTPPGGVTTNLPDNFVMPNQGVQAPVQQYSQAPSANGPVPASSLADRQATWMGGMLNPGAQAPVTTMPVPGPAPRPMLPTAPGQFYPGKIVPTPAPKQPVYSTMPVKQPAQITNGKDVLRSYLG